MDQSRSDTSTVDPALAEDPDDARYLLDEPPRLFALVADCDLAAEDPCYDPDQFDPGDVLVWGMEFGTVAVTYTRDPRTGRYRFGTHVSAASAHRFYRRFCEVRLVYQTPTMAWLA